MEVIDLITDEESDQPLVCPPPNVGRQATGKRAIGKKRKRSGWRKRAGDPQQPTDGNCVPADLAEASSKLETSMNISALRSALLAYGLKPGARKKSSMALRLVRARQAEAAAAAISFPSSNPLPPRFDTERAGTISATLDACRLCARGIEPPRRTFCSDECVHFHLLRTSGSHVRKALALRDGKRCAQCGVDAGAAYRTAASAVRLAISADTGGASSPEEALALAVTGGPFANHARLAPSRRRGGRSGGRIRVSEGSFWQADHVIAVHEGGGCCGIENLRTLCSPCHAAVTAGQARRRATHRQQEQREQLQLQHEDGDHQGSSSGGKDGDSASSIDGEGGDEDELEQHSSESSSEDGEVVD